MEDKAVQLTDPHYISARMFAKVIDERFFKNQEDNSVKSQAMKLLGLLRSSGQRDQVISDILFATKSSGQTSPQRTAEIGFLMGLQYGFELAQSYPVPKVE